MAELTEFEKLVKEANPVKIILDGTGEFGFWIEFDNNKIVQIRPHASDSVPAMDFFIKENEEITVSYEMDENGIIQFECLKCDFVFPINTNEKRIHICPKCQTKVDCTQPNSESKIILRYDNAPR